MLPFLYSLFRTLRSLFTPKPTNRDPLGPLGEQAAAALLKSKGFTIIGCNLRVPMGEVDILCIAPDTITIVLVEVKSRRLGPGEAPPLRAPEASVTEAKRKKLTAILRHLCRANRWWDRPMRIDVVGVEFPSDDAPGKAPTLRHHESVITLTRAQNN